LDTCFCQEELNLKALKVVFKFVLEADDDEETDRLDFVIGVLLLGSLLLFLDLFSSEEESFREKYEYLSCLCDICLKKQLCVADELEKLALLELLLELQPGAAMLNELADVC